MPVPYSNGLGTTWGIKATRVAARPASEWSGRGIRIGMLDTGIDLAHPDLSSRIVAAKSFVDGCSAQDTIGHGTHCAGTAAGFADPRNRRYGIARDAEICVGRVLDETARSAADRVLAAIDWALSLGCQIISLPLGTFDSSPSAEFEAAGRRALDAGCLVVAAAGNLRSRSVVQPANAPSIMAIGAVDNWLKVADFSPGGSGGRKGSAVDLMAPGVNVYSTAPARGYATLHGTSMATAHVAGIAALWAEAEGLRGRALWQRLIRSARPLPVSSGHKLAPLVAAP